LVTSGSDAAKKARSRPWKSGLVRSSRDRRVDEADRKGKQGILVAILETRKLRPEEVLIVGDNPDSEIEAGKT
jgi:hypothetical protein